MITHNDLLDFTRWEKERPALLQEMKELEAENALEQALVAKERFKGFIFRYRVLNKV
jgi:hypothetical protein